jgi:hypothetical protein
MIALPFALFLLLAAVAPTAAAKWPAIQDATESHWFPDARLAVVKMDVRQVGGGFAYRLECHPGGFEAEFHDYTGEFDCKLFEIRNIGKRDWEPTLLIELPGDGEWWSRGRFLREALEGECASYPEYGLRRTFRLRGMKVVLTMSRVTLGPPGDYAETFRPSLRSFYFTASVAPDPTANTTIAEKPGIRGPWVPDPSRPGKSKLDCLVR